MDEIYHIIGDDLWKLPESSSVDVIQATEFWLHHETNKVKATTRKIEPIHREAWLNERKRGTGPTAESLLVRIVWVVASTETISLSTSAQTVLFKRFGLQLAGKYFRTFYSGVAALPRVFKPEFDQRAYAFCYGPKIGATWSHSIFKGSSAGECITECLIFSRAPPKREKESTEHSTPDKDELKELQRFLEKVPWNAEICRSSAFPAYLFSLILSRDISETQAKIVKSIRTIESLTGFHEYANRKDGIDDNEQSLVDWSGECSGHAAKLASATRKAQVLRKLLEFITKTVDEDAKFQSGLVPPSGDEDSGPNGGSLLKANVELLQNRLDMQQIEVEHTLKRAEIQIEALFQIISQRDTIYTHKMAIRTEDISRTSQRDASSMKTLAVVTMFFLPGSFISGLFSTPTFDWDSVDLTNRDSIGVALTPQFRLYCAITVPLTLVTFILYFLWLWFQSHKQKKSDRTIPPADRKGQYSKTPESLGSNGEAESERRRIVKEKVETFGKEEEELDLGKRKKFRFGSWRSA